MTEETAKPDEPAVPGELLTSLPMTKLCVDFLESEAGTKMIQQRVSECCDRAIQDTLRSYGPFQEQLKAMIKRALNVPRDFDVASYNETLLNIVRTKMAVLVTGTAQQQVGSQLEKLLAPAPESIKLSTLVEQYVASLKTDDDEDCVCYGDDHVATAKYWEDPKYKGSFSYLELSDSPGVKQEQGQIRIGFSHMRGSDVTIYQLRFREVIDELRLFVGPFHDFERSLLQMKVGATKIILDPDVMDDVDLDYGPARD